MVSGRTSKFNEQKQTQYEETHFPGKDFYLGTPQKPLSLGWSKALFLGKIAEFQIAKNQKVIGQHFKGKRDR